MNSTYDRESVRPMWEELAAVGVTLLTTPEAVDEMLGHKEGTTLLVINSVCGCAAGNARPGATRALQHRLIPDRLATVFAGVDREAVDRARAHMKEVPPSSPFIAIFKDGELAHVLPRTMIEQMNEQQVADNLTSAFDQHCSREGPSVSAEEYEQLVHKKQAGSNISPAGGNFRSII